MSNVRAFIEMGLRLKSHHREECASSQSGLCEQRRSRDLPALGARPSEFDHLWMISPPLALK
jgi:hypothetical protein